MIDADRHTNRQGQKDLVQDSPRRENGQLSIINNRIRSISPELVEEILKEKHPPQLSSIFSSAVLGIAQYLNEVTKVLAIPLRADNFGVRGAEIIISEVDELLETFSIPKDAINITTFFSSLDRRVKSTADIFKMVMVNQELSKYLNPTGRNDGLK